MFKNYDCKDGLTIKKLKEILKDLPEKDKYGNDCTVEFAELKPQGYSKRHKLTSIQTSYHVSFKDIDNSSKLNEQNFANINLYISNKNTTYTEEIKKMKEKEKEKRKKKINLMKYLFWKPKSFWKK